jgi:radical SAM protein with 4Fe4S-binding SPASM domain
MLNLTTVMFGTKSVSDSLRYGRGHVAKKDRKPVVVWTMSRRCNLHCLHCYTASEDHAYPGELSTDEGYALLDDLAQFGVPALLMSGGEPLYRPDFSLLAERAASLGLRVTISTNGTLIDEAKAALLKKIGVTYVGISLDGPREVHDLFRQKAGAYDGALRGVRHCRQAGLKVGLRLTLTQHTYRGLESLFQTIDAEGVERVCFYHLVYSGRGRKLQDVDLSHAETRDALDKILKLTEERLKRGQKLEVLTVDQSADGPYLALKMAEKDPLRAAELLSMLRANGGGAAGSGVGIANIDPMGGVHPDQFWQADLGNIRHTPFSQLWTGGTQRLLNQLRDRLPLLKGRCGSCAFKAECGGSFRARAVGAYSDPWAEDPACYLSDAEISQPLPQGALPCP